MITRYDKFFTSSSVFLLIVLIKPGVLRNVISIDRMGTLLMTYYLYFKIFFISLIKNVFKHYICLSTSKLRFLS